MKKVIEFFLGEKVTNWIVIINVLVILIQCFVQSSVLDSIEYGLTIAFISEMLCKVIVKGKGVFRDVWDRADIIICILTIPTFILILTGVFDIAKLVVLGFRAIRILKIFRMLRFFKSRQGEHSLQIGLKAGIINSPLLLVGIFFFTSLSTIFFQSSSPEHFGNPALSLLSTIQVFTIEGWYEIPASICNTREGSFYYLIQFYFILQLVIYAYLLIVYNNSVGDWMSDDNDDEMLKELAELRAEIKELKAEQEEHKILLEGIKALLENRDP
ncbi:MAG: ion transporter [Candidatus Peribacteria bacterium]|jgi:voltage-gated sodium channel|nr:ion transporter [Candidatus Peribacteria bacterium]